MKRIVASAIFAAVLAGAPALAADLPAKGPVYKAPPAVFNWTGWYGGINAGYGWDPNYFLSTPGEPTEVLLLEPHGPFVGFVLGYNWHYAPNWLVGIEADFQFSDIRDNFVFTAGGGGTNASLARIQIQNFATVRGRFGYVMDRTLFFVTGGVAFGNFDIFVFANYDAQNGLIDTTKWEVGYVVGLGIERMLGNNWTAKIEYQFLDFGTLTATGTTTNGNVITLTGEPYIHTVRIGLNRRFATGQP